MPGSDGKRNCSCCWLGLAQLPLSGQYSASKQRRRVILPTNPDHLDRGIGMSESAFGMAALCIYVPTVSCNHHGLMSHGIS